MDIQDKGTFATVSASAVERTLDLSAKQAGVHSDDEVFYCLDSQRRVEWVVSRICDHSNGKLRLDANACTATCPLHGWRLSLKSLTYENVQLKKPALPFQQQGEVLTYSIPVTHLMLPAALTSSGTSDAQVRFLAHACIEIRAGGVSIVTDPWLVGPCFATGWWHLVPPPADAMEVVARADAIYLSHNHPDHMHVETLQQIDRNKPLLIPDFESRSVEKIARAMGFQNINVLKFNHLYELKGSGVHIAILPAGDFRDDSGLYFADRDFSFLATVDANRLNQYILPQDLSLLLTSFAGGASGFPLCFQNYTEQEKRVMLTRTRNGMLSGIEKYVGATRPRAYMPYAGYFTEAAARDSYIRQNNKKNSPADIRTYLAHKFPDIAYFDPTQTNTLRWDNGTPTPTNTDRAPLFTVDAAFVEKWISSFELGADTLSPEAIKEYFRHSGFEDDLVLFLVPCSDAFEPLEAEGFVIDFRATPPIIRTAPAGKVSEQYVEESSCRQETGPRLKRILARQGTLWRIIRDQMPWEDISIGFQCRIHRTPDTYNSKFWFHFTNIYIGEQP